jgi:hypothetical protein
MPPQVTPTSAALAPPMSQTSTTNVRATRAAIGFGGMTGQNLFAENQTFCRKQDLLQETRRAPLG